MSLSAKQVIRISVRLWAFLTQAMGTHSDGAASDVLLSMAKLLGYQLGAGNREWRVEGWNRLHR